jgi:hypothetical protein
MVKNVALGQFFADYFGPVFSVAFHRCSILIHSSIIGAIQPERLMTVPLNHTVEKWKQIVGDFIVRV